MPGWHGISAVTRRVLRIVLICLVVVYFIFCALFLGLRYVVLPNIDFYKPQVEQLASRAMDRRVSIATIHASWRGLRPHLSLNNVVIFNKDGQQALSLPKVAATLSWWSVTAAELRLENLEITRPDLDIERDTEGNIFVAGILIDQKQDDDGKGLDWVLAQREIVIRDGWVRWNDALRGAPELVLNDVDFVLHNQWRHHRLALTATPPENFGAPVEVRADFVHPAFLRKVSDFKKWKGTLYADWRNTDLAIWRTYLDYPFEVQTGQGAIRAWLNFDQSRIVDFTADLTLSNVTARLRKDLQLLNLKGVNGRVSASEATGKAEKSWLSFGSKGHSVALTNFSFETQNGLKLAPTTIRHAFAPATKTKAERTEFEASLLDLQALAEVVEHLPLDAAQRKMLADLAPEGELKDFSAQWEGTYPDVSAYRVKGEFKNLSMKAQPPRAARAKQGKLAAQAAVPGVPGFNNISGRVDASQSGGEFMLASDNLTLYLPGYFSKPDMQFERLDMQARWDLQDKSKLALRIDDMKFQQEGVRGSLSGTHVMPLTDHGNTLGIVDLSAKISEFDLRKIGDYLPVNTPKNLHDWLSGAFEGGVARDVALTIKGDVKEFPFIAKKPAHKPAGIFTVNGKIENGRLNYSPGDFAKDGKAPLWPLLEEISGEFSLNRTQLRISADSANTNGIALADVNAVIPDLLAEDSMLTLEGNAAGPLQAMLDYVNQSPVVDWIANFTEESKASGNAKLALKIALPLHEMKEAKVQGTLQFAGNAVTLQKENPPILQTQGELKFNENGFALSGIKGSFLGGAVAVNGGTQRDGTTVVKMDGSISVDGLRKSYPAPAMQRLFQRIGGSTRYAAAINIKNKQPEIIIESGMQGISLDFPAPLRKGAGEALPLKFELMGMPSNDALRMRDEIRLSLGTSIAARYAREKLTIKDSSWKVMRGGIGVNVPAPQPDSGLIANVSLKSLDIDAWRSTVTAITGPATANEPPAGAVEDLGISQYFEPDVLAARTTELYVMGKKLDNVVVGASNQKGTWQANIDSEQASGYVTWTESASGRGLGRVTARLSSLIIPQSAADEVSKIFEEKSSSPRQIPGMDIVAENFQLFGKKLGQLEILVNHVSGSKGREWRISKLALINSDAAFRATGKWINQDSGVVTNLTYALDIDDAGRLLNRFGFANVLRGGKGKLDGDISWKGLPFAIDMPTLSGQLHLDMLAGQFLKVEPGAAKLLGVLSLQSLPRRLVLDFRDVFSAGFAFDGVVATAKISNGMLTTDNFKMRGVNAVVLMDGTVDIVQETQDLNVVVIPEINAGAASIVYGLAINPVVGLGSFLAQLFLRDPLMKAFTVEYQITGPWADPAINKIPRKVGALINNRPLPDATAFQSTYNGQP